TDPRPGLAVRLRRPGQCGRALHLLSPQEDRRRSTGHDPHPAGRRLCPAARSGGQGRSVSGGRSLPVAVPGPLARGTLGRQLLVRVVVVVTLLAVALSTVATLVTRHLLVDRIDEQLTA